MSEQTSQEPTMEEILASIRRIISEDEIVAEGDAGPPAPAGAPEAEPEAEAEPLELTDKVEALGDPDVPGEPPSPAPSAPEPGPVAELVGEQAATAVASAFGQLSAAVNMPREGRTLEDVVRELLTPLLQRWLDENLPRIVQETVEAEVARIVRSRGR